MMPSIRRAARLSTMCVAVAIATGCASTNGRVAPGAASTDARARAGSGAPVVLHGHRMHACAREFFRPGPPGTPVSRRSLGVVARAGKTLWFALADRGRFFSVTYPAVSTDAGRTWRIAGPCFYHAGADGANATTAIAAHAPASAVAWSRVATVLKATGNGGKEWFVTYVPGDVLRVASRGGGWWVWVRVRLFRRPARVHAYVSSSDRAALG